MKKFLTATSAAALCVAAGQSFAAERPTATVGGYVGFGMVYGDGDALGTAGSAYSGKEGFGVFHDGEIHLGYAGSTDNGLTFTGRIEFEAFSSSGDQVDEAWSAVSGAFGRFVVGTDDTAYQNTSIGILYAPLAKIGYWDEFSWTGENPVWSYTGDTMSVQYYTPTIAGFTAGFSYHPTGDSDGEANFQNPVYEGGSYGDNQFTGGVAWKGEFNGLDLGIGAGYATSDEGDQDADTDAWRVDGLIGYGGFQLNALYEDNRESENPRDRNPDPLITNIRPDDNGQDLAIGARYVTGPWTIGGGWTDNMDSDAEYDRYAGWITYAIAPGVTGTLGFQHSDSDVNGDNTVGAAYLAVAF